MKKILLLFIISTFTISNTYSYNYILTWNDLLTINKVSSKIKEKINTKNPKSIKLIENKISELQEKYKNNNKIFAIFDEIKKILNKNNDEEIKNNDNILPNNNVLPNNTSPEYLEYYKKFRIDFDKVDTTWLNWHNYERNVLWIKSYSYDDRLKTTAYEWSTYQNKIGEVTHKRDKKDSYYNYQKIDKWFSNRWVKCEIVWWATTSESIWKHSYYCKDNDCSDELIESMRKVFFMYMKEKNLKSPNNPHYKWIVNNNLSKMWLGISIKESKKNHYDFYLTTHYCTKFKE